RGDAVHAILCGIGHNLRQMRAWWARRLSALWICWVRQLIAAYTPQNAAIAA
ncbi:MAG: IS5 family transposase, partial [Pseudomonadota bacterium]